MTNHDVIKAWASGRPARTANLSTDGHRLYSYALLIGEHRDGLPVVFNYTARDDSNPFGHRVPSLGFVSQTTSHHVSLARRVGYCFERGEQAEQEAESLQRVKALAPRLAGLERLLSACESFCEVCGCSDSGCPTGHGSHDCGDKASQWLVRVDDAEQTALPFCDDCASDAYESGIFASADGSN
jgi:hypothetical protein